MTARIVWEGVYGSFAEARGDAGVFEGEIWLDKVRTRLRSDLADLQAGNGIPPLARTRDYPLPLLVALLHRERRPVRVIDFGGGLAPTLFASLAVLPGPAEVEYHVVETSALCRAGREDLAEWACVQFHEELPRLEGAVDVVQLASALHYIEDWRGLLARLLDYAPHYLLLADLPAGSIPTFVTLQRFHGRGIPVWMWDLGDVTAAVAERGYDLIYRSRYIGRIDGVEGALPTGNLPSGHQLDSPCHLLFARRGGDA
ncbi:MAG: methyltransferase, TIGR04325 family [Kiloniellales bacterium]